MRGLIRAASGALLLLFAVLGFLLGTQTGLMLVVSSAAHWLPGSLSFSALSGRLIGPLTIDGLRYEDGPLSVDIRQGEFDWAPWAMLDAHLRVNKLAVHGLEIHLPQTTDDAEATEPFVLPDIRLPFTVDLEDIQGSALRVFMHGDAAPIALDAVHLSAATQDDTLNVQRLVVAMPQGSIDVSGTLTPSGAYPMDAEFAWRYHYAELGPLSGSGSVTGSIADALRVDQRIDPPMSVRIQGDVSRLLERPSWNVEIVSQIQDLGVLTAAVKGLPLTGQFASSGSVEKFQVTADLASALPEVGPVHAALQLSGSTRSLSINQLTLRSAQDTMVLDVVADVNLDSNVVAGRGEWRNLAWPPVGTPRVQSRSGQFTLRGSVEDYKIDLRSLFGGPELGNLEAVVAARGSEQSITLSRFEIFSQDTDAEVTCSGALTFADRAFRIQGQWQELAWPMAGTPMAWSPTGQFSASGTPRNFKSQIQAKFGSLELGDVHGSMEVIGSEHGVELKTFRVKSALQLAFLELRGRLSYEDLGFQANGSWYRLLWPMVGEPLLVSPSGDFDASGSLDDYRYAVNAGLLGPSIPEGHWTLNGRGSQRGIEDAKLEGQVLEGGLLAGFDVTWMPELSWRGNVVGSELNPGAQWPGIPGALSFELDSQGHLEGAGPDAVLSLSSLSGEFRGQEVQGAANLKVHGNNLDIEKLGVQVGDASLSAAGQLSEHWDLVYSLEIPKLGALVPDGAGSVKASGDIQGLRERPEGTLDLDIAGLALTTLRVDRLQGKAHIDGSGDSSSDVDLRGSGLTVAGSVWQDLRLEGSGTPAEHGLKASASGDPAKLNMRLSGSFQDSAWTGTLSEFNAVETLLGDWRMDQPMALRATTTEAKADRACLRRNRGSVCLEGDWQADHGSTARVTLDQFNLRWFRKLLPDGIRPRLKVDGELAGSRKADGTVSGNADLRINPGEIDIVMAGVPTGVGIDGGKLTASSDGHSADMSFGLELKTGGELSAEMAIASVQRNPTLSGRINGEVQDMSLISTIVPQLENVEGRLLADIGIQGPLLAPTFSGGIRLLDGLLEVPSVASRIEAIELAIVADGHSAFDIDGAARAGSGEMRLKGRLEPTARALNLSLVGENFQLADSESLRVALNPDLQLSMVDQRIRIDGQIHIPKAYISSTAHVGPADGVAVSSDVVFVDRDNAVRETEPAIPLEASVRVILGDDVRIDVSGLNARLNGNLLIEQSPRTGLKGRGEVGVERGQYYLLNQDFEIKRGQLNFNGPLDNPGLNVEVERRIDQVTAGARIYGLLKDPELTFYSRPGMEQEDIVSYLLFGRPASASGTEGANLPIGRYLTPDLYASYGIGLFDQADTFRLRYRLSRIVDVETTSTGETTGVDFIFRLER